MLKDTLRAYERETIAKALLAAGHNRTHTAETLGISRRTLLNKIHQFGLRTRSDVARAAGCPEPDPNQLSFQTRDGVPERGAR